MKTARLILIWSQFILTALFPAGKLIAACFGYTFEPANVSAFAITLGVLSVCAVVLDLAFKDMLEHKVIYFLLATITPLSFVNAALCIFACPQIWVVVSVSAATGCCFFLAAKQTFALKIVAWIVSVVIIVHIGFCGFIAMLFCNIGQNAVVQTLESPNGQYYAQVIDSDQGALGGDTLVDVYQKCSVNLIFLKIEKKPQRVYFGDWGAFRTMQIYWKDDNTLVINSVEYEIE